MFKKYALHISFLTLLLIVSCATKPQSDVDTPEYHFKAGMRAIENEDYQQSITSFQRSVDLDNKFALGGRWLRGFDIIVEEINYKEISKLGGLLRCSTLPLIRE